MQRFTLRVRCYFAHFFRRLWFVVDRRVFRSVRAYQRNSTFIHIPLLSLFSFDDFPCCFDYERDVVWNSNRLSIMCNHCHSSYENVTELRLHWNRREQWSYNEFLSIFQRLRSSLVYVVNGHDLVWFSRTLRLQLNQIIQASNRYSLYHYGTT